jgi:PncC family amidohydrolase
MDPDAEDGTVTVSDLAALAGPAGTRLRERAETVAVAESSSGGLISAALLAVPGASAYFKGGGAVYTTEAKRILLGLSDAATAEARAGTETHALHLAEAVRRRLGATWGIGETGAAGPSGNRYGDPPGHVCLAVAGPVRRTVTMRTGSKDRAENMAAFARAAVELLGACIRDAD